MHSTDLTDLQKRVCDFIAQWTDSNGFAPTIREIAKGLNYKSLNAVRQHVRLIRNKGHLDVTAGKARTIRINSRPAQVSSVNNRCVPLIGAVAAGTPILAEENREGSIALDPHLFKGEGLFTLRVRGMSMRNIGVLDGDIAIVKQQQSAENGEVVVALIDGEATLKRFFQERDRIVLRAENPSFPDIVVNPSANVSIVGKLVGVIRKY